MCADDFSATYLVGWNFGNHYREATQHRHSQVGFWATVEQPLVKVGRVGLAAAATVSHQFKDPEVAVGYWNGTLAANNLTRRGGTLALVLNRAYYNNAHETDTELTFAIARPGIRAKFLQFEGRQAKKNMIYYNELSLLTDTRRRFL